MTTRTANPRATETARAIRSTHLVFALLGLAGSSWASHLPQIQERMDLDAASVGFLLLLIAVGGVMALPLAGPLVGRVGPRRAVTAVALLVGAGLGAVASGFAFWPPLLLAGLFALGTATGFWDVAVTVHAAALERRLGRPLMPRFFAGFSLGTVAGACLGALMTVLRVPVGLHVGAVALLVALAAPAAARYFLPWPAPASPRPERRARGAGAGAWRHRRTVLLGLLALAFALAEGAGSNWISLAVIDRHHTAAAVGTLTYAAFLTAVTLGRWLGPLVVARLGRPGTLRAAACAACLGAVLFATGPWLWTGFAGALLWGAGAALGFPLGLSAGSDDPAHAAARVGVITSIGYCGFVCGPPLIGALADRTGLAPALLVVAAAMAASLALSGAVRAAPSTAHAASAPPPPTTTRAKEHTVPTTAPVIEVSDTHLEDLRARLRATRWPEPWPIDGWEAGTDLAELRRLVAYWATDYDWRAHEAAVNALPSRFADIDGVPVHYLRYDGEHPGALPIVLTHGWPSTVLELTDLAERLAAPSRHGGNPGDSFTVIVPSLPGFAFSPQRPALTGGEQTHDLWHRLMRDHLGFRHYAAHGGDLGAGVTSRLAEAHPEAVVGIHLLAAAAPADDDAAPPTPEERAYLASVAAWQAEEGGYMHQQNTRPLTLAPALNDSPAGLLSWVLEKYRAWSDCGGDLSTRFSDDFLLTQASLYWFTGTISTSFRPYYEYAHQLTRRVQRVDVPTALAVFPADLSQPPRSWAERTYHLTRYTRMPRGGHFAAHEEPALLAEDITAFFRDLRPRPAAEPLGGPGAQAAGVSGVSSARPNSRA